jgi:hypothetical protein
MPSSQQGTSQTPIRVSVSCLAELIKSPGRSADSIARLLRPFKFNKRGEGFARSAYYKPTLTAIRSYHSNGNDGKVFDAAIVELRNKATKTEDELEKVKFEKNVDAIAAYRAIYGKRRFRVLPNHRIGYSVGKVVFTAQPDLWVMDEDAGIQVLLKIGITKKQASYIDILLTVIRKAAVASGYTEVRARNVVYLNVTTGKEMICEGGLKRFNRTFEFIARTITNAWNKVTPPEPTRAGTKSQAASA